MKTFLVWKFKDISPSYNGFKYKSVEVALLEIFFKSGYDGFCSARELLNVCDAESYFNL